MSNKLAALYSLACARPHSPVYSSGAALAPRAVPRKHNIIQTLSLTLCYLNCSTRVLRLRTLLPHRASARRRQTTSRCVRAMCRAVNLNIPGILRLGYSVRNGGGDMDMT